ncbi:MAG TPA: aspartate kinase [Chitinophagales bacterium]|nr:aspartate kinase [Chitinophagales bacterium]
MIKVFKFGGASIKDAAAIRNVAAILNTYKGEPIVIVVSALGKTTNALEAITNAYFHKTGNAHELLDKLRQQHFNILDELFPEKDHPVFDALNNTFVEIDWILEDEPFEKYDYIYDQVVSIGEMAATKMVSAYLNYRNIPTRWLDVRDCIRTDNTYREGKVDWQLTEKNISGKIPALLNNQFVLTQGFLGGTSENYTTTLGREGSDYTAAIFAYSLNAENVTIWKDVPGVLNADPRYFPEAKKIETLSYHEAIEMTYYGATVIHPKTIKPLQNKKIPLYVRSFVNPEVAGTIIEEVPTNNTGIQEMETPVLVLKLNQILISMSAKDFSFIAEDNLSYIFGILSAHRVKMNLMQNAAISFSICADNTENIPAMIAELSKSFTVKSNENLSLLTIRHYTEAVVEKYAAGRTILLEQKSRHTVQMAYTES